MELTTSPSSISNIYNKNKQSSKQISIENSSSSNFSNTSNSSNNNCKMNTSNNNDVSSSLTTPNNSNNTSSSSSEKFHVVAGSTPFVKAKEVGKVYKEATKRERDFYEKIQNNKSSSIYKLVPRYFGMNNTTINNYIILEDLTSGYSKPCIMDIKLGLTHHDLDLDILYPKPIENHENMDEQEVISRLKSQTHFTKKNKSWLVSKYITTPLLGFCLCGYQKYNNKKKEFEKVNKEQGRFLNEKTIRDKLFEFFNTGNNVRSEAIQCLSNKLSLFKDYFENNPEFKFRSTSLLLIYEGDELVEETKCDIRLIDFAHATTFPQHLKSYSSILSVYTPKSTCESMEQEDTPICNTNDCTCYFPIDGGYLFGVTNLLEILNSLSLE